MPETTPPPPEVHLPTTVGSTFMRQYYHLLAKEPASLHRFYKDESTWCHTVGSLMQESISGQRAINDEILRRGYAGARVDLDIGSIDCQASLDGGVLVMVTGVMTLASSPVPKPFVQTFFLAVQPKGYFVLNDCLRFLELPGAAPSAADVAVAPTDAKKPPVQAAIGTPVAAASPAPKAKPATPVAKKTPASPVAKPVETPVSPVKKAASPVKTPVAASPVKKAEPAAAPASPVKKAAPAEKAATPTPKPSETKPATPASPAAAPAKAPAAPASPAAAKPTPAPAPAPAKPAEPVAPAAPPAPKTWAALFSGAPAAAVASVAALKAAPAAPKPAPAPASPAQAPAEAAAKPAEAAAAAPQEKEKEKEKKRLYSLYIRDVPAETKESDLRELFKSYGTIASVGIPANRGIAFVDYREEASMRAALADDKEFKVHDKVLRVEERKDKEQRSGFRADSRGGRGGRGAPKSGRSGGDHKDRDDGKERRNDSANGKAPASSNGPRAGDRRDKGGRRSGKEDGGRGAKD